MAETTPADDIDACQVEAVVGKRLRALKKRLEKGKKIREAKQEGREINEQQEEVLQTMPTLELLIEELEKLREPLAKAKNEEVAKAIKQDRQLQEQKTARKQQQQAPPPAPESKDQLSLADARRREEDVVHAERERAAATHKQQLKALLELLYFARLFDLAAPEDAILGKQMECQACLSYEYADPERVANGDLLTIDDLGALATLGGLITTRPQDVALSHEMALVSCLEHATAWIEASTGPEPARTSGSVDYNRLCERLRRILASDYFTTMPMVQTVGEDTLQPLDVAHSSDHRPVSAESLEGDGDKAVEDELGCHQTDRMPASGAATSPGFEGSTQGQPEPPTSTEHVPQPGLTFMHESSILKDADDPTAKLVPQEPQNVQQEDQAPSSTRPSYLQSMTGNGTSVPPEPKTYGSAAEALAGGTRSTSQGSSFGPGGMSRDTKSLQPGQQAPRGGGRGGQLSERRGRGGRGGRGGSQSGWSTAGSGHQENGTANAWERPPYRGTARRAAR
mmetsp:Transcript_948/g.3401  ORF Transcript_948/g.3401 Transcript_948/m.3401 type:complete len:510 (+) Transcript_948:202-1731(+)|eukprot:scaffold1624_cov403-Prasinococcus_capsulatus_cf.AAC.3